MTFASVYKWLLVGQRQFFRFIAVVKEVVSSGGRGSVRAVRRKKFDHPSGMDGAFPSLASVSLSKSAAGQLALFLFVMPAFAGMFVLPNASCAQTVELSAIADRTEVQIADPFEFEITVTGPPDTKVSFQEIEDKLGSFDVLEVKDRVGQPAVGDSKGRAWSRTLLLETIETGNLRVPRIEISVQEKNGNAKLLRTDPVEISVVSVVESSADLTKFADIADLVDVEQSGASLVSAVWVSLTAGFVLALFACCLLIAKRRRTSLSARDWALAQLSDQESDFGHAETVMRRFLEERFAFPATSLSATLITDRLLRSGVSPSLVSGIEQAFAVSERVKFGGSHISQDEETKLLDQARSLIKDLDDTMPSKQALDPTARQKEVA